MLIYSAGLRVSEVVKLKPEDIDAERKLIHIKGANGRKDRYTILSDVAIETLSLYLKTYQPEMWLFPGQNNMPSKNVTLSVDEYLYAKYREFCKKKGWLISRQFEIMMEEQIKGDNQ